MLMDVSAPRGPNGGFTVSSGHTGFTPLLFHTHVQHITVYFGNVLTSVDLNNIIQCKAARTVTSPKTQALYCKAENIYEQAISKRYKLCKARENRKPEMR